MWTATMQIPTVWSGISPSAYRINGCSRLYRQIWTYRLSVSYWTASLDTRERHCSHLPPRCSPSWCDRVINMDMLRKSGFESKSKDLRARLCFLFFNTACINKAHADLCGHCAKWTRYTFRGDNSVEIDFASLLKRVYSKRKEFAPCGSKFFPFKVEHFSKGTWCAEKHTVCH